MKKIILLSLFLCFTFGSLQAQKKEFTLDEVFTSRKLYPSYVSQLKWIGKSNDYMFVANKSIVKHNIKDEKADTIVRLSDLNDALKSLSIESVKNIPQIKWINNNSFYFITKNELISYDISTKKAVSLNKYDENAENMEIEETNYAIAYTKDNNLFVSIAKEEVNISNEKNKDIVYGQAAHRNEFGIDKGIFWSPNGNKLAFYRMDQTMVTDYPLVNIDERIAKVENTKYPMAGMKSHEVTLGVFDIKTRKTIYLKTGEPVEQYLTNISWSLDEKSIFIFVVNREQNHCKLNQYDASSGDFIKTIFEEKNEKYVEPQHPLTFLKTKPTQFIYFSEKSGFDHLYLYDLATNKEKQLTKGDFEVKDILFIDDKNEFVFYSSTEASPLEQQVYALNLKSSKTLKMTKIHGTHNVAISHNDFYLLDTYSSTDVAYEALLTDKNGKIIRKIKENKDPLADYNLGTMKIFTIKASDGQDLYCRMILPPAFDSTKKYPVFYYLYGGPHLQLINDSWLGGAGHFLHYMAMKGYIVFSLDNRGTSNRGQKFEQVIHRNLGVNEVDDHIKGINYLKSLKYIDADRMGIQGWSYGGFMTISLMLKHPGVFKAAVAGGPVIDWKWYEIMYGERYMDTPEENPEGYKNASLLNYVKNLKGKLMLIHGDIDGTVVMQHSLSFIKKCVDEGVDVDFFVYPRHEHNVRGKDRAHLLKKIELYMNENVK